MTRRTGDISVAISQVNGERRGWPSQDVTCQADVVLPKHLILQVIYDLVQTREREGEREWQKLRLWLDIVYLSAERIEE